MNQLAMRLLWLSLLLAMSCNCVADDPPPKKPTEGKADLTEGLMDLLREPAPGPASNSKETPASPVPAKPLDGEDIGQPGENPLAEVQLGMNTLAQWLRSQPDVPRTKQLQRDVVLRLDELIDQLEKQAAAPSSASSSSAATSQATPAQASSQMTANGASQSDNPAGNQSGNQAGDAARDSNRPGDSTSGKDPSKGKGNPAKISRAKISRARVNLEIVSLGRANLGKGTPARAAWLLN